MIRKINSILNYTCKNSLFPFLFANDKIITYKNLFVKIDEYYNLFKAKGIRKKNIIAIYMENCPEFIYAVLALWKIGAIPSPLNLRLTKKELKEQIEFLGSEFLICLEKNRINGLNCILINPKANIIKSYGKKKSILKASSTALIMFTSGSSGKPKAVELTFNNLINSIKISGKFLKQSKSDRWLAGLPFYHIGGFSIITRAIYFRSSIIIPNSLKLTEVINSFGLLPTFISLVPTQLKYIVENKIKAPKSLRASLIGGGPSDRILITKAIKLNWKPVKVYGSTETASFICALKTKDFLMYPESSGKAILPAKVFIVDENKNPKKNNEPGEIAVLSPTLFTGYYRNKEQTIKRLKQGIFFSGDLGYVNDKNYLFVETRRSDLIISGGENINPAEVELVIKKFNGVQDVSVFPLPDDKWGQIVCAALKVNNADFFNFEKLKSFLSKEISSYKIPKKYFLTDELPRTETGKIKRKILIEHFSRNG